MKMTLRAGGLSGGVVAMLLVGTLVFAQDTKKAETKAPAAKTEEAKPAQYRLPDNFAKLSLSDDQKAKIKTVQTSYGPKIDELEAQLQAIRDKQSGEIEALLTPEQQKLLNSIRTESKQKRDAARAARAKAAEKKPEGEAAKKAGDAGKPAVEKK